MEKRTAEVRRQDHAFVADERRDGPYDRREDESRHRERQQEMEKIERIRAFKAKDKDHPSAAPLITKKRLVYVSLALLLIVVAVILLQ